MELVGYERRYPQCSRAGPEAACRHRNRGRENLRRRSEAPGQGEERNRRRGQPCSAGLFQSALPRRQMPARRDHAAERVRHPAGGDRDHQRLQAQLRSGRGCRARRARHRDRRQERHDVLPAVRRRRHDRRAARRARPVAGTREDEELLPPSRSSPFRRRASCAIPAPPS